MLLKTVHETNLNYSDPISESVIELRMAPRQEQDQHRLSFSLAIGPATSVTTYFDWLGNTVHTFSISGFHKGIRIVATSVVETDRPPVDLRELSDTWPLPASNDYSIYDYLQFGGPVVDSPLLRNFIEDLKPRNGMRLGALADRMLGLIDERFMYKKGITTAASPITDLLEHGQGVCQDFTHLMIGLARALKIPARYVSGLLHPNAGSEDLRGFTQTHAWCELFFPATGWIGFDPANNCVARANFVKVAIGRDYRDVPPNKGLYRGKSSESIDVAVRSEELKFIPSELAAERYHQLQVPVFADRASIAHHEAVLQQAAQQQQ